MLNFLFLLCLGVIFCSGLSLFLFNLLFRFFFYNLCMGVIDCLFPKFCIFCSKQGDYVCKDCVRGFQRCLPRCFNCKRLSNGFRCHNSDSCVKVCWYIDREMEICFKRQSELIRKDIVHSLEMVCRDFFKDYDSPIFFSETDIREEDLIESSTLLVLFGQKG